MGLNSEIQAQWGLINDSVKKSWESDKKVNIIVIPLDTIEVPLSCPEVKWDTSFIGSTLVKDSLFGFYRENHREKRKVEISILNSKDFPTLSEAIIKAKKAGYVPATIEELVILLQKGKVSNVVNLNGDQFKKIISPRTAGFKPDKKNKEDFIEGNMALVWDPVLKKYFVDIVPGMNFYLFLDNAICVFREL